jgi:hypothetical protein
MALAATLQIGGGGPLRRFEARCHLTSPRAQVVAALGIAWLPVVVLALASEALTGVRASLLHDVAMHVRLAIAMPVLVVLDNIFPRACGDVLEQLDRDGFIKNADRARYDRTLRSTVRLGEWWLPEAVLAAGALCLGIATLIVVTPFGASLQSGLDISDWWYGLVALPLFEFLLIRSLWRWAIWVRFLVGLSRLDLDLDPTHPDKRGGIGFLGKPSLAYCSLVLFVASAVLSAGWGERFQFVTLRSFLPLLLVSAAVAIIVAFGPLILFSLQLYRARKLGIHDVGGLAARCGRAFRRQWHESGEAVISDERVQSLAAVAQTYRDTVKSMRLWPFEKKELVIVLVATLLPVVPSMLARIPHEEWLAMMSLFAKGGL